MKNLELFVITGGPGSGKTTVLQELEGQGFQCAPEVARQIIQEQVWDGGVALPWADRTLYTRLMLERSIQSYKHHTAALRPTFFDRGIPDTLGYARLIGLTDDRFIQEACDEYRYTSPASLLLLGKRFTRPIRNASRISKRQSEPVLFLRRRIENADTKSWNCPDWLRRKEQSSL